jgi:hypothetical protein
MGLLQGVSETIKLHTGETEHGFSTAFLIVFAVCLAIWVGVDIAALGGLSTLAYGAFQSTSLAAWLGGGHVLSSLWMFEVLGTMTALLGIAAAASYHHHNNDEGVMRRA